MTYTVLVTGANRGIGLEFVKQYLAAGWRVFACCRQPERAKILRELAEKYDHLSLHALDVTSVDDIQQLRNTLVDVTIDVLLLNAGVYGKEGLSFGQIDTHDMQKAFHINVIAPLQLCEALIHHIAKSHLKKIVYISSLMGSVADNSSGRSYAYRASKAAGNMIMKNVAIDVAHLGIHVLILHPGWVKTDMGGPNALLDVTVSVSGMYHVIEKMHVPSGSFYAYDGKAIPW